MTEAASGGKLWICCQIGAREHYAVARALEADGVLELVVTDAWVPPRHLLAGLHGGLGDRFHADLPAERISAANIGISLFEALGRFSGRRGWRQIVARNAWFQRMAVSRLASLPDDGTARTLFAYSYAALDLLKLARARAWRTVLGQIDGGPHEERIVAELHARRPDLDPWWEPAPAEYWEAWRDECALADRIVVNSPWARHALEEEGIPTDVIRVLPLAYEAAAVTAGLSRSYPSRFTPERPLRVLFLGQINMRKGAGPLLEATRLLRDEPVEFWFVGPRQILVPADLEQCHNIRWFGQQRRSETAKFYREADVFILPTFSDGFGLTQLEAQSWKLPLIVSGFCGKVVQDGRNGIVLQSVTPEAIAGALRFCLQEPRKLSDLAAGAVSQREFGLSKLGEGLQALFPGSP